MTAAAAWGSTTPQRLALLLPVFALQAWLILTHEAWLDEWQALAIAIHSPDWPALLAHLRYEGHPAPWYGLLRALAAILPEPRMALPAAALALALITQALIALVAPFPPVERLALALAQPILFEFLTVSRSLTLGVATVFVALALWPRRRAVWLALAFLPQCDFLFGVIAIGLGFLRWREGRLWTPGVALFVASGLLAAWTVRPAPDLIPAQLPFPPLLAVVGWALRLAGNGLPFGWENGQPQWNALPPLALVVPAGLLFAAAARAVLRRWRDGALVFSGFLLVTLVFCVFVYALSPRHMALAGLMLVALAWLRTAAGDPVPGDPIASGAFRVWLLVCAVCGLATAAIAARQPFDNARAAVVELARRGLAHKPLVALPNERGPALAALTGRPVQPYHQDCAGFFLRWNQPSPPFAGAAVRDWLARRGRNGGSFVLASQWQLPPDPRLYRPVAAIPPGYDGFSLFLYDVRPDLPFAAIPPTRCEGAQ